MRDTRQTDRKTYSVTADPKKLRRFAGDDIVVGSEVSGYSSSAVSTLKPSREDNHKTVGLETNAQ